MSEVTVPFNFEPRSYQLPVLSALARGLDGREGGVKRALIVWHRRAGKEKTLLNFMVNAMLDRVGVYYYFFPTYAQGKKILWDGIDRDGFAFMRHFPDEIVLRSDAGELKKTLINGSIFQIIGTDKIDSVVGTNPIGCVFSEYSLQDPRAWDYMRPILRENGGWAAFDMTPRGKNHGFDLYQMAKGNPDWYCEVLDVTQTKRPDGRPVITQEDIEAERREGVAEEMIEQEYYCSWKGVHGGTYYASLMEKAESEGRIGEVPWEEEVGVETWWDIGVGDSTAIWFTQSIGKWIHVIDYYENSGMSLPHYAKVLLNEKPYTYLGHHGPHDLMVREWSGQKEEDKAITRWEIAKRLGIKFEIVANVPIDDGIAATRILLPRCRFDKTNCKRLISALQSYHREFNAKLGKYNDHPHHDWSSHPCDAGRMLGVGHRFTRKRVADKADAGPPLELSSTGTTDASNEWMAA